MKVIYSSMMAIVAAGALSVTAMAEEKSATQPGQLEPHGTPTGKVMLEKGFIKKGDKVFMVERISKATKLEGIEIDNQGNLLKDGKRIELKEGQMLTPEGQVSKSPLETRGQ